VKPQPQTLPSWSIRELVAVARPRQWTKSSVCLAALIFSGQLVDPVSRRLAFIGFVVFCLVSSASYVVNDVRDRHLDAAHPVKRARPLAAGRLPVGAAVVEAVVLAAVASALSIALSGRFQVVLGAFAAVQLLYTFVLKQIPIVDVMAIALGFVLRVQSGIEAIGAPQSAWILLCMFFMALFLGFGKRRGELTLAGARDLGAQRPVLAAYSLTYLDVGLALSATTALVCYSLYAVTVQRNETFLVTVLPVAFGILRYMMLVVIQTRGEGPDEALVRDGPIVATVAVWTLLCIAVLYFGLQLFPPPR
jgi:decaprenyl-phosphate phosphoribosyltransferase